MAGQGSASSTPGDRAGEPARAAGRGLRICLLGRLELAWGEEPLPTPRSEAARSLLAYLALRQGRPVSRELALDTLWPERTEAAGRKALSHALWQLRGCLGPAGDRLEASPDAAALILQPGDWLDVADFEKNVKSSRSFLIGETAPVDALANSLALLDAAVQLYHGDLLPDCYEDWIIVDRERLRESHLWALERLVTLSKQWGDYEQALAYAQRLAAADPLRESAHAELMRLYHLLGRDRAACEQYSTLCRLLEEELGDTPNAATDALYREILAAAESQPSVHLPSLPAMPALRDLDHLPFIGRAEERALLLEAVQAAAHGQGGVVLLEAPAGGGKTRLANEVVRGAEWRGLQTALARVAPEGSQPYQELAAALGPLLTPLRLSQLAALVEPYHLSALAPILPTIMGALPDLPTLSGLAPAEQRTRLWEGLGRCLIALGTINPLLVVIEDVHWATQSTLEALQHVVAELGQSRVLLLLTCRLTEVRQRPAAWKTLEEMDRTTLVQRVSLSPLNQTEVEALIRRLLPGKCEELASWLWQQTGGTPLLLVEALKSLLEQGLLDVQREGWAFNSSSPALQPGASVQTMVKERLRRLPQALHALVEMAAVLGEEADFATLSLAVAGPAPELIARLGELERLGFLEQVGAVYRLGHDLVREAVYQAIAPTRRKALHRQAGEALEQAHPERIEALAHHFGQGEMAGKAIAYNLQSAEQAQSRLDYQSALACYDSVLGLVGEDAAARWNILARKESALELLARREEQDHILLEMLNLAGALADPQRRAECLLRQGRRLILAMEPTPALPLLEEVAEIARSSGSRGLLGQSLIWTGYAWWYLWEPERCQATAEAAQAVLQEIGDLKGEEQVSGLLGNLHLGLTGNLSRALACFKHSIELDQRCGNRHGEATSRGNAGIVYGQLGYWQEAVDLLEGTITLMAQMGDRLRRGIFCHHQALNWIELGQVEKAQARLQEALDALLPLGNLYYTELVFRCLGKIALADGDLEQARHYFLEALNQSPPEEWRENSSINLACLAQTCLQQGRLAEATDLAAQALTLLKERARDSGYVKEALIRCFQIVAVTQGIAEARPLLEQAFQRLMDEADRIDDPEFRRSFLERVSLNREIAAAHESGLPLPIRTQSHLPSAAASPKRPPREQELAFVTWTLFAADDVAIPNKVERRQHRLQRLLSEAAAQGAAPTIADLATVLGVTPRTVKRDLASLRAAKGSGFTRPKSTGSP